MKTPRLLTALGLAVGLVAFLSAAESAAKKDRTPPGPVPINPNTAAPHPAKNPGSRVMLAGAWVPADPGAIDFEKLPRVPVQHIVISDVRERKGVNQHNYLIHHAGRFWAMWSDGPKVEDMAGQVVKYATSVDGVIWTAPQMMTDYPPNSGPDSPNYNTTKNPNGFRYISRGFWVRDGQLLALMSLDDSGTFFGRTLELRAMRWNQTAQKWEDAGVVQKNAINNFPPEKLPNGEWAMTRRQYDYQKTGVQFLIGGVAAFDRWTATPVVSGAGGDVTLKAEEPIWYGLPDGNLTALFRDNAGSRRLYRAFSTDNGRTWSPPVITDFPDARAKLYALRLQDGRYALVSNSNPAKRDPLTLALSRDGLVYDQLFYVVGGRPVDYPHMIEHDGFLYIAHSGAKQSVEVERVRLADLATLRMPSSVR